MCAVEFWKGSNDVVCCGQLQSFASDFASCWKFVVTQIEGEIALLHQCLKEEIITEAEYRKSVMLQLSKLVLLQSPRGSKLKLLTEMMQEGKITKPEMQMIGRQMLLSTGTETEREGTATLVPMVMSAQKVSVHKHKRGKRIFGESIVAGCCLSRESV